MDRLNAPAPRVLLCESDGGELARYTRSLAAAGLRVDTATSLEAARVHLQASGRYAAIVGAADLADGPTEPLVADLRRQDPTLPFLVLSGTPSVERVLLAMDAGVQAWLPRTMEGGSLARRVLTAAAARRKRMHQRRLAAYLGRARTRYVTPDRRVRPAIDEALDTAWLAAQPIVQATGELHGYELFLRNQSTLLPSPTLLVSACRLAGRIGELGRTVRRLASEDIAHLPVHIRVYVNVDPAELIDEAIHRDDNPLHPVATRVTLNLTERKRLGAAHLERLQTLRERGYRVAIDQLGRGYAGLNSLVAIRPDVLKLDGSLVGNVSTDPTRAALVSTLVKLCASLGVTLIAEGVEVASDALRLTELGVTLLQGYHIARPTPLRTRREVAR